MKKSSLLFWLKGIIGLAIVIFLAYEINRKDSILEALESVPLSHVAICVLLLIPNVLLAAAKWHYLLKNRFPDATWREAISSLLFGYSLGLMTPGRLGELGRGLLLNNRDQVMVTGLNVLDKLANHLAFFLLGWMGLCYFVIVYNPWTQAQTMGVLVMAGMVSCLLVLAFSNPALVVRILSKIAAKWPAQKWPHRFVDAFRVVGRRDTLALFLYSFIWTCVVVVQYHILMISFFDLPFYYSFAAVSATFLVKMLLPLTIGDLGIRETILVYFYCMIGISEAPVFNGSLLIFLINVLIPGVIGLYYVFQLRGKGMKSAVPELDSERDESIERDAT